MQGLPVHLTFQDAIKAIRNIKRSDTNIFSLPVLQKEKDNEELFSGNIWRPLNMELEPFGFTKPLMVINEGCTEAGNSYSDKSLLLYKLSDLTV
jgi:hypothetical protein